MIVVDAARELGQIVHWLLAVIAGPPSDRYGGFDLTEGDRDPAGAAPARYGGVDRPGLVPAPTYVTDLHRDLRTMGFLGAPAGATVFDRRTRWAVQEFQRYAALHAAAVERPDEVTTTAAIGAADVRVPVSSAEGLPATAPYPVRIGAEVLTVTGGAGTQTLTVRRGQAGTAAAPHDAGTAVAPERWSDRLRPEPAWFYERYPAEATGVVNAWTRFVLDRWIAEQWRCPIVVEAWDIVAGIPDHLHMAPGAGRGPLADNLWLHTDLPDAAPRMFVRDLTPATWPRPNRPPDAPAHPELDPVGEWTHDPNPIWTGPVALPERHTWHPEGEILPEHLLPASGAAGPTLDDLVAARDAAGAQSAAARRLSTYKVVRAVAEVEAVGFFDGLNSWDKAFLSLGLCHWTAGPTRVPGNPQPPQPTWNVDDGELWGFLSYLKEADPDAFAQAVGRFGVDVDKPWDVDGHALFLNDRKYATRPTAPLESGLPLQIQQVVAEFDMFRSWHWFYRFVMAGRTVDGFRRRMWHMARLRIRDLLATPWDAPAAAPTVPNVADPAAPGGTRRARIGDVLTSERTVAFAYRWHILSPGGMVTGGHGGASLHAIVTAAGAPAAAGVAGAPAFNTDPTGWGDAHEAALIPAFLARALVDFPNDAAGHPSNMVATLNTVHQWPAWGANPRRFTLRVAALPAAERTLLTTRGSFEFDTHDLPPAPP